VTGWLEGMTRTPEQRERALKIGRLVDKVDETFRVKVVPALTDNGRTPGCGHCNCEHSPSVRSAHDEIKRVVTEVVETSEGLNRDLERLSRVARERERALRRSARLWLISCFALAIALAALLGFTLTRSIRSRLERLREGAAGIAAGDLSTRIAVAGADEFADLAGTFNQMAADLQRHQGELVRSQKLATVGQIAAGVAHEINNPLGVILGYTKLMRKNPELGKLAGEELGIVEDEAHQCQRIVRELLDLARPPRFASGPIDLGNLVRDAVDRLAEASTADSVKLEVITSGPTPIFADDAQLREVVSNLVSNAIEAGSKTVTARVTAEGGLAILEVADTGSGMTAEVVSSAFDPFFTTKPRGTGLGLAIVQAIVQAHGGEIRIESTPGSGTRVRVELPLGRDAEAGAP
jgi:signal transduction histidine kinase